MSRSSLAWLAAALLAPVALLAAAPPARAADTAVPTELRLKLPERSRIRLRIEKSQEDLENGRTTRLEGTVEVDVHMLRRGEGYEASWQVTRLVGDPPNSAPYQTAVPYRFTAEADGRPAQWLNWDAVRDAVLALVAGDQSDEGRRSAQLIQMFRDSQRGIPAANLMMDATMIAGGQNSSLILGQRESYETDTANPLGGPPIKTRGYFLLESLDRRAGRAMIEWGTSFDRESASASVTAVLPRDYRPRAGEELKLERRDKCRYEIDIATGVAVEVTCETVLDVSLADFTTRRTQRMHATQTVLPHDL